MGKRDSSGRFLKGHTGNPGGRPKILAEVLELARAHTNKAIDRLAQLMDSPEDDVALRAGEALLTRAWGRPLQSTQITGADGGAIDINVNGMSDAELAVKAVEAAKVLAAEGK